MRIALRADATAIMGGGHVIRCLTLANILKQAGAETQFTAAALPEQLREAICQAGHTVRMIKSPSAQAGTDPDWETRQLDQDAQERDAGSTIEAIDGKADWLIVDHYLLDRSWEQAARAAASAVMVLDDLANRPHDCDLLLDQTSGRSPGEYTGLVPAATRLLLGPNYALLRPEFAGERPAALVRRRQPGFVRRILVSLGATDVGGHTLPSVRAALAAAPDARVDVVIGRSAPSLTRLQALASEEPRLAMHVDTAEMAALMRDADLAIGASGSTSWERCCLGLPTVALVLADNQRFVAEKLAHCGAAIIVSGLEDLPTTLKQILADPHRRLAMTAAAAALTDGEGAERVAQAILEPGRTRAATPVRIRPATQEDAEPIWLWRNDPVTRSASQTRAPVPWPDHITWFNGTLAGPHRRLFIAERDGSAVGMVRFDALGSGNAYEVNINIRPDARGGGTGRAVLAAACRYWVANHAPAQLEAVVHEDNRPSRRIFEALGFVPASALGDSGFRRYVRFKDAPAPERQE